MLTKPLLSELHHVLAVHMDALSKCLRLSREKQFEPVPRPWCFNGFDYQIALPPQSSANFADLNLKRCSEHASFDDFALAPQRGANFGDILGSRSSATPVFRS